MSEVSSVGRRKLPQVSHRNSILLPFINKDNERADADYGGAAVSIGPSLAKTTFDNGGHTSFAVEGECDQLLPERTSTTNCKDSVYEHIHL